MPAPLSPEEEGAWLEGLVYPQPDGSVVAWCKACRQWHRCSSVAMAKRRRKRHWRAGRADRRIAREEALYPSESRRGGMEGYQPVDDPECESGEG